MVKIKSVEYFRVPPRWLFVKITDEEDKVGWGEASLEGIFIPDEACRQPILNDHSGHTQAVEGCLDAYVSRITGMEAEYVYTKRLYGDE